MAKSAYPTKQTFQKQKKRPWYIYVLTFLISFFLLTAGIAIYIWKVNPGEMSLLPWAKDRGAVGGLSDFNILVAGLDNVGDTRRTDSIIVAHISLKDKYANLISIPRDSRVEIPGVSHMDKINSAFARGESDLFVKTIEQFLGAPIDYYVVIRLEAAEAIINAMGGVDIDVEKRLRYHDRAQHLDIDLQKGFQHLDGKQAVGYSRFRHDATGDYGRIERQQKMIQALAKKATSFEIVQHITRLMLELIKQRLVYTNLTFSDGLVLARSIDDELYRNIKTFTIPSVPESIGGVSYVIPDQKEIPFIVSGLLKGGFNPRNRQVKIEVQNGCGSPMLAQIYKQRLEYFGFDVTNTDNATDFDHRNSLVVVRKRTPFANSVAKLLGAELVTEPDPNSLVNLEVVLGRDKLNE
jgi:polyisoprenyl-teichoic acid--peptidoglycan teichoic acid transferase